MRPIAAPGRRDWALKPKMPSVGQVGNRLAPGGECQNGRSAGGSDEPQLVEAKDLGWNRQRTSARDTNPIACWPRKVVRADAIRSPEDLNLDSRRSGGLGPVGLRGVVLHSRWDSDAGWLFPSHENHRSEREGIGVRMVQAGRPQARVDLWSVVRHGLNKPLPKGCMRKVG